MPSEVEEIEAILRDQIVLRQMGEHSFMEGFEEAAAAVAALRARDREDGAREMRERAAALCHRKADDSNEPSEFGVGFSAGCERCADDILDLLLTTRTESGDA